MLVMEGIRRYRAKVKIQTRLDLFFIKINSQWVFINDEHECYLKAKMKYNNNDKDIVAKSKQKLASTLAGVRTSSKVAAHAGGGGSYAGGGGSYAGGGGSYAGGSDDD